MQFLMLRFLEGGASLADASDSVLRWGLENPDVDLFERRTYREWCRTDGRQRRVVRRPAKVGAGSA